MSSIRHLSERLIALFLLAVLLLNPPLLRIFDHASSVMQIPTLYLYLFSVWGLLIVLLALITELAPTETEDESTEGVALQSQQSGDLTEG
ncbi:MAG: hypothetical protein K0U74_08495 [Alphaproteobacteria bacterium]|nr:hypothetical protein [Alphaproteobacteria bacterium]